MDGSSSGSGGGGGGGSGDQVSNFNILTDASSSVSLTRTLVGLILFFGSFVSIIFLLVSLFIFSYFPTLRCTRLRVHRNLFIALVIHSVLLVLISGPIVMKHYFPIRFVDSHWLCRAVIALKIYASMAATNWMFVEGLVLHTKLSGVFTQGPPFAVFYAVGWGVPALIVMMWSSLMILTLDPSFCWKGYGKSPYVWIITVPMIAALVANAVFLVNIIRILILKIKDRVNSEMRKALRATALLFPLLGMNQLIFCINPRDENQLEDAYMLINSLFQSSQGLLVSVLYCFNNTQVRSVISAAYCRHVMVRNVNSTRLNESRIKRRTGETIL